jgi:hypothetical protein
VESVWVFNGTDGIFPAGVFTTHEKAESWICLHRLSGCLTKYPLDVPLYDWAIESGVFTPKKPYQCEPNFIQSFSSASLEHYHYENGARRG